MSKILKRPMFRKGGQVEQGVMSLASGGRAKYANGTSMQDLIKDDPYLQEVYGLAQAGYGRDVQQERGDVLANLLIRGGLNISGYKNFLRISLGPENMMKRVVKILKSFLK